jgi:hypothetical protein
MKVVPYRHVVQFHDHDRRLLTKNVSEYLSAGLERGEGLVVIATTGQGEALRHQLVAGVAGADAAIREGLLVFLDARETLARFMVDGKPDWGRFVDTVGAVVREVRTRAHHTGLRAYGEMVSLLWNARQHSAAISLEHC